MNKMTSKLDDAFWNPEDMNSASVEYHKRRAKGEATVDLSATGVMKWAVAWEEYQLYFGGDTYHKGSIHMPHVASSDRGYEISIQELTAGKAWRMDGLCWTGVGIKKYESLGSERATALLKAIRGIGQHLKCSMIRSRENDYDFHYLIETI